MEQSLIDTIVDMCEAALTDDDKRLSLAEDILNLVDSL